MLFWMIRGENSLLASKDMDDRKLGQNERRSHGASIDAILSNPSSGLEIGVLEVSGPPNKRDHRHFREDRVKIAINLKKIYKKILEVHSTANPSILKKIVPIGLH